ncbi:MAG TPA: flagellar filament capping protein FliD [Rugosimonospora sp.]|nr:flagellar filament capping protein FliD [Rugosimonospora sp.]
MSGTSSISGLVSGLDTSSIISQLMQLEAQPQALLKQKVSTEQGAVTAYQAVNTKMSALQILAETLTKDTTWQAAAATSSSTSVVATASAGAPNGQYTFDVTKLAAAQVSTIALPASGVTSDGNVYISINGAAPTAVPVTTDTPQGVANAINANSSLGIRATIINSDQGAVLQLVSTKTGSANAFAVTGVSGTQVDRVSASDAQLTVGTVGSGGYTVTSPTNTFSNFIPNVTLTATGLATGVTVTVNSDASGLADKIGTLVDAANAALSEISNQTAYTPANQGTGSAAAAGPLLGDLTVQDLGMNLLSAVANGDSTYGSFSQLGLQTQQDGTLVFDKSAFIAAYQANPSKVQAAVENGLATTLNNLAKGATDIVAGTLTTAIQGRTSEIKQLNAQIDDWTTRLADRQNTLQQQFTAMEVSLGQLKNQSSWLSSQIASLPTTSSASSAVLGG